MLLVIGFFSVSPIATYRTDTCICSTASHSRDQTDVWSTFVDEEVKRTAESRDVVLVHQNTRTPRTFVRLLVTSRSKWAVFWAAILTQVL